MDKVHFSSEKDNWETPQTFFDKLNDEFHFDIDVCADANNAKCPRFLTQAFPGALRCDWTGLTCWMNPPYGRQIGKWVKKAYETAMSSPCPVVCLLPARTDTKWWHDYVMQAAEIRFVRGRLQFVGAKYPAPFPSCVVVFKSPLERHGLSAPICTSISN